MKLFLISQDEIKGYDMYDSAVVCAIDEEHARNMDPMENNKPCDWGTNPTGWPHWCSSADKVKVQFIGDAADGIPLGVVCASFNAG